MIKKQIGTTTAATQSENPTVLSEMAIIKWGPWPLWIITGTAVGSTSGHFHLLFIPIGIILGGCIGGIIGGLMPYLERRWRISKAGWWAWTLVNSALTVTSLFVVIMDNFELEHFIMSFFALISYGLYLTLGIVIGLVVAKITRWVFPGFKLSAAKAQPADETKKKENWWRKLLP